MTTRVDIVNHGVPNSDDPTVIIQSNTRGTIYVPPGITRVFNMEPDEILVMRVNGAKEPTGVKLDVPPETGKDDSGA